MKKLSISIILFLALVGCRFFEEESVSPASLAEAKAGLITILPKDIEFISLEETQLIAERDMAPSLPTKDLKVALIDFDQDGVKEAASFYRDKKRNEVGFIVATKKSSGWKEVAQGKVKGENLTYGAYEDLTGDQVPEVILGVREQETSKTIVFPVSEAGKPLLEEKGSQPFVTDLDGDKQNEILILNENKRSASLLKYQQEKLVSEDELSLDTELDQITLFVGGKLGANHHGVIVRGVDGNEQEKIVAIIKRNNQLTTLSPEGFGESQLPLPKNIVISDMNKDGIIEIPMLIKEKNAYLEPLLTWYQLEQDGKLKMIAQQAYQEDLHFKLNFPQKWLGKVGYKHSEGEFYFFPKEQLAGYEPTTVLYIARYQNEAEWKQLQALNETNGLSSEDVVLGKEKDGVIWITSTLSDEFSDNSHPLVLNAEEVKKLVEIKNVE
ncbi:hypothetical protein IC619_014800 [Hazenella sp. IB182353]|uniref:hypothetical protein n=1 Tax=Polycladospora coralii TaxID=2771432 RepID=UPI0017463946|nr:hypothetical protein [Polycladospora coralii]MBS7531741.1 hypothetical protein [Polycladospora coralii]